MIAIVFVPPGCAGSAVRFPAPIAIVAGVKRTLPQHQTTSHNDIPARTEKRCRAKHRRHKSKNLGCCFSMLAQPRPRYLFFSSHSSTPTLFLFHASRTPDVPVSDTTSLSQFASLGNKMPMPRCRNSRTSSHHRDTTGIVGLASRPKEMNSRGVDVD